MKLSKYAEELGIKYKTAHEHFKKGLIPGAYQLGTGTIIVPDALVDKNMLNQAIAEDLDKSDDANKESDDFELDEDAEAAEAKPSKPRTQTDMLKTKLSNLKNTIVGDSNGFDATQFVAGPDTLPKPPKKKRDYDSEAEELKEKAANIIDTHIHNYITEEELMLLEKNNKMREAHIDKLFEIDFLIKTSKDMIIRLKEGIDDDEAIPNIYTTLAQFQTQMMTFMNNRSKHLTEVENYWYDIADKHGLFTNEEIRMEELAEKQTSEASPEDAAEQGRIVSQTKLNEEIEAAILELSEKEKAKADNNPRMSHNPYDKK
jgi:hypothetical protein